MRYGRAVASPGSRREEKGVGGAGRAGRSGGLPGGPRARASGPSATLLTLLASALLAHPLGAQSPAAGVADAPDGTVRLETAARPDVCGDGHSTEIRRRGSRYREGVRVVGSGWECGVLRLSLRVADGRVRELKARIGGRWPEARGTVTDLGRVSAPEAGRYLMSLAREAPEPVSGRAVFPAAVVDSFEAWPGLLAVARDRGRPEETREKAIFWVAQAAGDAVAGELEALATDADDELQIRERAVFALSRLSDDRGVPALIRVVRRNADPRVTRKALFWLGQAEDPRALDLFEEILTGR